MKSAKRGVAGSKRRKWLLYHWTNTLHLGTQFLFQGGCHWGNHVFKLLFWKWFLPSQVLDSLKKKSDSPWRITICHRRRKIYLRFRGDLRRVVQKPFENSCTVERGAASEKEEQPVGAIALKKTVAIYSNTILFCKVRLCNNQSN